MPLTDDHWNAVRNVNRDHPGALGAWQRDVGELLVDLHDRLRALECKSMPVKAHRSGFAPPASSSEDDLREAFEIAEGYVAGLRQPSKP